MAIKVGCISLGCPKNQVNAERMLAAVEAAGMRVVENVYHGADVVVVNTCAFIDDAKKEAVESILEMAALKDEGLVRKIVVTGCLAQGYRDEIVKEIPEVDAVLGLGANGDIVRGIEEVLAGGRCAQFPDVNRLPLSGPRKLTTPEHWAYLQIAEGCSNHCAYCKIPALRGEFRSREMEDVLAEARTLVDGGVRELVLIAQDTTRFGWDIYHQYCLPELLRKLCKIDKIRWIRLLYCYPDEVTDELVDMIASEPKVVKYIDLPLQHADDRILKAMGRRGMQADIRRVLTKLRAKIPGIAIRTTFISGFPGEDEAAFEALSGFIEEQRFAHMGVFTFSPQEGTPAYAMPGRVEPEVAQRRAEILMQQQAEIAAQLQNERIGHEIAVMVEEYDPYTDSYTGRSSADTPEIDNYVTFTSARNLQAGDVTNVEIFGVREDGLLGRAKP